MSYEFTMPWPPSVGSCWRAYQNRFILSKKGRQYRKDAIKSLVDLNLFDKSLSEKLSVTVILNPPTLGRYDVDNFTKALFDALTHGGFWVDDEQVQILLVSKGVKTKGGNVLVKVEIID
jgi:crossover junction endodeoxyribonuclease RusA